MDGTERLNIGDGGAERERFAEVCAQVERAARAAGRAADEIALLLVSKTVPPERLRRVPPGVPFGENRVQELVSKASELGDASIEWHFIGHLQRNKVKALLAVPGLSLVQSVDRLPLAEELDRRCRDAGGTLDVLVQVNASGEATKFGAPPAEAAELARRIDAMEALRLKGLMTIGPHTDDVEAIRRTFRAVRELRDRLEAEGVAGGQLRTLSMGMSSDFSVAIAEGSTLVRVGRAVFGERPPTAPRHEGGGA